MNSTWLITSELANQRRRKVLFICVVYTNCLYYHHNSKVNFIYSNVEYSAFCKEKKSSITNNILTICSCAGDSKKKNTFVPRCNNLHQPAKLQKSKETIFDALINFCDKILPQQTEAYVLGKSWYANKVIVKWIFLKYNIPYYSSCSIWPDGQAPSHVWNLWSTQRTENLKPTA